jgi:hypothetical protein
VFRAHMGERCSGAAQRNPTLWCPEPSGARLYAAAFVQVPVQRGPAHAEVLGDIPGRMTVDLHPPRGGDVVGVGHLLRPPELRTRSPVTPAASKPFAP